jgi:excisionase family DNA binding protein
MPKSSTRSRDQRRSAAAPTPATRAFAAALVDRLDDVVIKHVETGHETKLDALVADLFRRLLSDLAAGHAVTIMNDQRDLSTFEAASLLGISRPHLIKLIERGGIAAHRVGTHRRIRVADVWAYKTVLDARRRAALADLTRLAQQRGEY